MLCLCPQASFLVCGRFEVLTAEQNHIFDKECKLLLVSSLKRIQGGLINQFFFHIFHNKAVYESGQERMNCVLTHTGTNYLVVIFKTWKNISRK